MSVYFRRFKKLVYIKKFFHAIDFPYALVGSLLRSRITCICIKKSVLIVRFTDLILGSPILEMAISLCAKPL